MIFGLERWGGDAHSQHEAVALGGVVSHRVSADGGLGVAALEREHVVLIPSLLVFTKRGLVDVFVIVHLVGWDANLSIRAGDE